MVLVIKLLCAVGVGVLVFDVSRTAAFRAFRTSSYVARPALLSVSHMGKVREAIETYRQEHHALPDSLRDLSSGEDVHSWTDESGAPVDGWYGRLEYSTDGADYELVSYGRDGRPGGVGLDADLSTADLPRGGSASLPVPERALATYQQFVADHGDFGRAGSGYNMFRTCIVAGVVAFLVALVALGRSRTGGSFILSLVLTTAGALLVGVVVSALHIPVNH